MHAVSTNKTANLGASSRHGTPPWLVLSLHPHLHKRRSSSCYQRHATTHAAADSSAAGSPSRPRLPVVILPGYLTDWTLYEREVAGQLRDLGHATSVVPIKGTAWAPTLMGSSFTPILTSMQEAVMQAVEQHGGQVALVGFSAGGWLGRILLGDAVYDGRRYGLAQHVHTLLTLGSPHLSTEQYPFGRVAERRTGEDPGLPDDVAGSSLRFAMHHYPTGGSFPGVQLITVVGQAIQGQEGSFKSLDSFTASISYKANCGRGDVAGDGVVPLDVALLPGAKQVVLPGVHHLPKSGSGGGTWYGSPQVVQQWDKLLP